MSPGGFISAGSTIQFLASVAVLVASLLGKDDHGKETGLVGVSRPGLLA